MHSIDVYMLKIEHEGGHLVVVFKRFVYCVTALLPCRQQDIRSFYPLTVKLVIPIDARIHDMRDYEGQEVLLVLPLHQPQLLQSE